MGNLPNLMCANSKIMKEINISFTGEYSYTIDNKGRLNIPAKYRKALNPVNKKTFIVTRGFDANLIVYPVLQWVKVEEQLSLLSSIKNKDRSFVRSIVRHATYTKYDAQGRIQIPESLQSYAKIKKEILIIGMINKIELWNPIELQKIDKAQNDNYEDLSNEIKF